MWTSYITQEVLSSSSQSDAMSRSAGHEHCVETTGDGVPLSAKTLRCLLRLLAVYLLYQTAQQGTHWTWSHDSPVGGCMLSCFSCLLFRSLSLWNTPCNRARGQATEICNNSLRWSCLIITHFINSWTTLRRWSRWCYREQIGWGRYRYFPRTEMDVQIN